MHISLSVTVTLTALLISSLRGNFVAGDETQYTINYCSNYICPKYYEKTAEYLTSGCIGDFEDMLTTDSLVENEVNVVPASAFLILLPCSFLVSMIVGVILGKEFGM